MPPFVGISCPNVADLAPVRREHRCALRASRSLHQLHFSSCGRHDVEVDQAGLEVGVFPAIAAENDGPAVRRPGCAVFVTHTARGELLHPAFGNIDDPQVSPFMAKPALAVSAVEQACVVTRYDAQLLLLLVRLAVYGFLILLCELQQEAPAIRRPCQAGDVALEIRKATRLPAVSIDDINLRALPFLARREECKAPSVGRPPWRCICLVALSELAFARTVCGRHPQIRVLLLCLLVHPLNAIDDLSLIHISEPTRLGMI